MSDEATGRQGSQSDESVQAADQAAPLPRGVTIDEKNAKALRLTFSQRKAIATRITVRIMKFLSDPRGENENPTGQEIARRISEIASEELHTPKGSASQELQMQSILSQLELQRYTLGVLIEHALTGKIAPTDEKLALLQALGLPVEKKERSSIVVPGGLVRP